MLRRASESVSCRATAMRVTSKALGISLVPVFNSAARFCSSSSTTTTPAESAPPVAPGTTQTVHVDEITDQDRDLLNRVFNDPASLPKHAKNPMGDGGGAGTPNGEMAAVFTCNICKLRSVKRFTKHAYTKGIVIVQCSGCGNKHLLADHMGWFVDEHKTIEEILKAKGEEVKRLHIPVEVEELVKEQQQQQQQQKEGESPGAAAAAAAAAAAEAPVAEPKTALPKGQ